MAGISRNPVCCKRRRPSFVIQPTPPPEQFLPLLFSENSVQPPTFSDFLNTNLGALEWPYPLSLLPHAARAMFAWYSASSTLNGQTIIELLNNGVVVPSYDIAVPANDEGTYPLAGPSGSLVSLTNTLRVRFNPDQATSGALRVEAVVAMQSIRAGILKWVAGTSSMFDGVNAGTTQEVQYPMPVTVALRATRVRLLANNDVDRVLQVRQNGSSTSLEVPIPAGALAGSTHAPTDPNAVVIFDVGDLLEVGYNVPVAAARCTVTIEAGEDLPVATGPLPMVKWAANPLGNVAGQFMDDTNSSTPSFDVRYPLSRARTFRSLSVNVTSPSAAPLVFELRRSNVATGLAVAYDPAETGIKRILGIEPFAASDDFSLVGISFGGGTTIRAVATAEFE